MITTYNDGLGHRGRNPIAVLVTAEGQPHRFTGESIPGVCQSTKTGYEKNGKWSNSTFEILHHDSTVFVSWRQDWDTGVAWPQSSWDEGFQWLKTKAPALEMGQFERFVCQNWCKAAEKWDAQAAEIQRRSIADFTVIRA